ncbi:putative membrane protein [Aminobacter aminovorans]|uniref:Predicted integral membrane protein n=1 Tax=Aminobacter aminovorans TaxID=83263 RepID=A0A380WM13_AMIAI|nr:putative membrane protein [Aminobacter aminovorans]SUU89941.1 Predicted integral membrane protein [Aminobacter aminovorans]
MQLLGLWREADSGRQDDAGGIGHRTDPHAALFVLLTLLSLLFAPSVARAEFTVCNQTLDVVNLAVGQEVDAAFQTDGWWTIGANQCVNVIREELTNRYIYVYATDVFGNAILSGSTDMCVERKRFTVRGIDECWQSGHIAARFFEVDTLEQARWTFFLTGSSP